jgi:hypothetical protein
MKPIELDEGKLRTFVSKQVVTQEGRGLNSLYTIWPPDWCPLYTSDRTLEAVWKELEGDLKVLWDEFVNVEEETSSKWERIAGSPNRRIC